MKNIITIEEYQTMKIYELNNFMYNRLTAELAKCVGDKIAARLMEKWMYKTIQELSCNSYFDVVGCFVIIS